MRLGTGILIVPQRNPLVLAKELATLDYLSGGRMILGAGIGWLAEEFQALGIPFAGRGPRTEEAIGAMRALWSEQQASFEGNTTNFRNCFFGHSPAPGHSGPRRRSQHDRGPLAAGRMGDGFFPFGVSDAELHLCSRSCGAVQRRRVAIRSAIELTSMQCNRATGGRKRFGSWAPLAMIPAVLLGGDACTVIATLAAHLF